MSELYDRINNFCCLSAIRNRELFKDTDYKTVYDLVDDLSILRRQLEVLKIIKRELVIEIKYNYLTEKYDVYIYGERGLGDMTKIEVSKEEGDILKEELQWKD